MDVNSVLLEIEAKERKILDRYTEAVLEMEESSNRLDTLHKRKAEVIQETDKVLKLLLGGL